MSAGATLAGSCLANLIFTIGTAVAIAVSAIIGRLMK